jgi:hypothetical protein
MRRRKIMLILGMCILIIAIGIGYVWHKTQESIDNTDSFTKELLENPEPYVGKEVTLTLDKKKYFAIVDFLEPSRKHVYEDGRVAYKGGYNIYHETINISDGSVVSVDIFYLGDPISIKGAKAVKLTGEVKKLRQENRMVYVIETYKAEPIY